MDSIICEKCGTKNFENAMNCRSCLQVLSEKGITRKRDGSVFPLEAINKIPESTEYQRPDDYNETTGYWQRLKSIIWDRDIHVIKEISARKDLQSEARLSLLIAIVLMSIITIIDWSLNQEITVSLPLFIFGVFILVFSNSYLFIFIYIYLGRLWAGSRATMNRNYIFRPVAYIFSLRALETFVLLIANTTDNSFIGFFWFILLLYSLMVSISVFSKIFNTKLYIGVITVIFSFLISFNVSRIILIVVFGVISSVV